MSPDLADLLEYFAPLATTRRESAGGVVTLLTPGTNVLGLNAAYVPAGAPDPHPAAPVTLSERWGTGGGDRDVVAALCITTLGVATVDPVKPGPAAPDAGIVVEQVGRLHLPEWCRVLAQAHGTPGWAGALALHFAAVLETRRDYALLLAYRQGEAVGAALWRPTGASGNAAHLWGVRFAGAQAPLLQAAQALGGGPLRYSRVVPPAQGELFWVRPGQHRGELAG